MSALQLFDVNGCIGEGAYGIADFPEASDLIRQMDYLGIDRCLVWHVLARDLAPAYGNRKLLEMISEKKEFSKRLLPAFVITPSNFYEYGVMDFLQESFRRHGLKALRIFPRTSRFDIRTIERILGEVSKFEPVVLWDFKDSNGPADCMGLVELSEKFPQVRFVLTGAMWGQFNNVVDIMWRSKNVFTDISWLHMRDTIELLRDEFGAERILFGTGFRSHYGASIAALQHARITDSERSLISCGNAGRLLGITPLSEKISSEPVIINDKPVWKRFSEGFPVEGVEVIDAHAHIAPSTRGWILRDVEIEDNVSNLILQMDACGVSKTVVAPESGLFSEPISGNLEVERIMLKHLDRFAGYLAFNPWYSDRLVPELDGFFSRGFFVGLKILASYWRVPVEDKRYVPAWEYANRYSLPILLHTWDGVYDSPGMLKNIVSFYPDAKFLLGHAGGGTQGRAEAVELARENANVFLEFCGSFTTPADWLDTIKSVGIDKVIFGSDTGAHGLAWELGRFLSIPLPDKELIPAMGQNFKKILSGRN
jgi:uncharacterized protein